MAELNLDGVGVDFPLFFAGDRSFKRNLLGSMSGHATAQQRTMIHALEGISLPVLPGTRLALLGGNAAGKTTLLRVMAGLLVPSAGRVHISGRAISVLGTGIGIDADFTARQTIIGQGLLMGFTLADCRTRLARAADFAELSYILDMPLKTLGQGHQVRVALGIAAAYDAEILLIDEMLEHLAPPFIDRLCLFIDNEMPKGSIVVVAERSKTLIDRICNRAVLLHRGHLVDQGPLAEMTARHDSHLTR
jgi:ABC-type polysaccharide/polyol phosphate transport system ATPase subunit